MSMMKSKILILLTTGLMIFLNACTPKIVKYHYDNNLRVYEVTIKESIVDKTQAYVRLKDGRKIQSEADIKKFVKKYNKKAFDIKTSIQWDLSEKSKYELSKLYYNGTRAYKKRNFKRAIKFFIKAVEKDKNIVKYSDIYYLTAKSYYYLGDNEKAQEYFKKFIEYSESITHHNFYYFLNDKNGEKINELFEDADNHLKENPEDKGYDFALKHHYEDSSAKYRNRYYKPGFVKGRYLNKDLITLGLYYSSNYRWGLYVGIYAGLLKRADFDIYYLYTEKLREFYLGFPFSIYSDKHKRFGIKFIPAFYYTSRYLKEEEPERKFWKSFPNFSGDISIGYYINHYWLIFTGYKHYYYNKENPYEFTTERYWWKLWKNNNYYIGNTVYLFKDIGITLEYRYENVLTYLEIASFKIGYNISEDKAFLSFLNFNK